MPTYQYACTDPECGNRFELVQAFTDPAVTTCPVCSSRVRKVYGSVGVVFKGSGFYRTDSRADGKPNAAETAGRNGKDGKDGKDAAKSTSKDSAAKDSASSSSTTSTGSGSTSSGSSSSGSSSGKAAASA